MLPSRECAKPAGDRSRPSKAGDGSAGTATRDAGTRRAADGRVLPAAGRES
jgi:hypothetical protein